MLSLDERKRVRYALEGDPRGDMAARVAALIQPQELHSFALLYNVNDSMKPSRTIIRMKRCDRGTALRLYWLHSDFVLTRMNLQFPELGQEHLENWGNGVGLIEEIESNYLSGFYETSLFKFDPMRFLQWSEPLIPLYKKKWGDGRSFLFPEQMLHATPGIDVAPDWRLLGDEESA